VAEGLVFAAGVENRKNHQVRVREEPLFGFCAGCFRDAGQRPEMPVAGQAAQVFQADAREGHDFFLGKDLLAGFDSYHVRHHS
jgi:hypothetical protein